MNQVEWTVGKYLIYRLKQIGVHHMFAIPGDYVVDFVLESIKEGIEHIGNTNEINAGYAADGYARLHGISAIAVTYGVGAYSLLNTIAGAYVEKVPIVVINGAPSIEKHLQDRDTGLLWHHMMNDESNDLAIYRHVTVAAEQLSNPHLAPLQIDRALTACLTESQPVYLETFEDIYTMPCAAPEGKLSAQPIISLPANLEAAVKTAVTKITQSRRPIIWGGVEVQRLGIQEMFTHVVAQTSLPYATSLLGKSIISEDNPAYIGIFEGKSSSKAVQEYVANVDCLIALGVLATDINLLGVTNDDLSGVTPWGDDLILASRDSVRVGTSYFAQVHLADFLDGLGAALAKQNLQRVAPPITKPAPAPLPDEALTFDNFFNRMNTFVDDSMMVLADIGFSSFGAMNLNVQKNGFIAQAAWASIGYAVGAALGAKCARPELRPVVFSGDGSFHMTCQTLSTMYKEAQNPIIFVMNNGIYGIEQWLVNPKVFAGEGQVAPTNILHRWEYSKLTEVFGGRGWCVSTIAQLDQALAEIQKDPTTLAVVDVRVEQLSFPEDLAWAVS